MSSANPTHRPAPRLGRYELVGRLAQGGTSTVYLGRAAAEGGFSREFAIKVLHPHLDPLLRTRFLDEARLSSRVRHPNIVSTVDLGADHGLDYLVLELVDGVDLRRLQLARTVPLRPSQAAFVIAMVARGVHALHTATDERGQPMLAVHRDLSPHNIMLDREGRAVLIDLGLAKIRERSEVTQVGVLCGRIPYMSPEQATLGGVDARSDVFSLGTVLFELLTGRLPFGEDDTRATHERVSQGDTAEPLAVLSERISSGSTLGQGLVEIIATCLQRDPAQRFDSALALADALEQQLAVAGCDLAALQHELAQMAAPMCEVGRQLPRAVLPGVAAPRRTWRLAALAAAVVLVGVGAWMFARPTELVATSRDAAALASDGATALRSAEASTPVAPAPTPVTVPVPVATPIVTPTLVPAPLPVDSVPARTTKSARKRNRALKPNPYAGK
jgi:serine/threonine-protein kinase